MSISYELTKDDGVALMKYLWQRPERRHQERKENDTIAVAFAVVIWMLVSRASGSLGLLVALAIGLALLQSLPRLRENKGKKWVNSDGFQQWLGSRTVTIEDSGLRVVSTRGERLIYWASFSEVIEAETHLFLPFGMLEVVVIPARAFESPDTKVAFLAELKARQTAAQATQGIGEEAEA
ncbi:YcxB family protein [Armatimonas rosea]|uniref:YcxB-like C-terminal domain-containing protein n=1 Tax=Armatimonas rosea TaxID=685828 RepID=A0A7W9W6J1_ARMRO|nr:YcxB family protein [Armatimonas rosea]MBB6050236.1 hypothetical protein [Armatimonas rosea]